VLVESRADLRRLIAQLGAAGVGAIAQELIPGPETAVESYHVYVDESGAIAAEFTGKKIRTSPPQFGQSTALEITADPRLASLGREIVEKINLHGVAKLDFKRAPDGTLHLMEINPRFSLWHHLGAKAGVNIPAIVYADLVGLQRPSARPTKAATRWCHPRADFSAARIAGISTARWLAWLAGCDAKSGVSWDDPLPLVRRAAWQISQRLHPTAAESDEPLPSLSGKS
jgi:predicted ATP-grasp superfamily ATP-dependent carboligase